MIRLRCFCIACLWIPLLAGCGSVGSSNLGNSLKSADSTKNGSSTTGQVNDSGSTTTGQGNGCGLGGDNSPARVLLGGTHQFAWSYATEWEVNRIPGGNEVFGTISSTGLYTAPAIVPLNPVVTIIARCANHSSAFMSADVGALTGRRFAYVSSASDNAIEIFAADGKTGTLQPVSVFDVGAGKSPAALALSPNGNFLYSLNRGTNDISVYAVDPSSGNLTNAGSVAVPNGPNAMVFSARGKFAYVSCDGASEIAAFAVNLQDGSLSPLASGSYAAGGRIQSLAIALDGNFLYAANPDSNQIIALSVASDGSLRPITGSPFPAQPGLSSIVVNDGDYEYGSQSLYAGSNSGIEAYDRNPVTGVLTYKPSGTQSGAGNSPLLFANTSDGLLIGVDPQSGGGFSFAFDYLAPSNSSAHLSLGGPPVSTGTSPVAGAWLWGEGDTNWIYVLNGKADASAATGSIGVYPVNYSDGMVAASTVIATALHDPSGLVITP